MYMAARPGLLHKHIPISFDPSTRAMYFPVDGICLIPPRTPASIGIGSSTATCSTACMFLKRPYFLSPECHAWTVIGAHDFADIHSSQIVLRTERWSLRNARQPARVLKQRFDAFLTAAQARGLTSVWLLYDEEEALASLVYFAGRARPERSPPAGLCQPGRPCRRTSARRHLRRPGLETDLRPYPMGPDHLVPVCPGRSRRARLMAEYAAILSAFPDDGVCEVSRGESSANSPECMPQCGDGIAQTGETSMNCPGDVRLFQ